MTYIGILYVKRLELNEVKNIVMSYQNLHTSDTNSAERMKSTEIVTMRGTSWIEVRVKATAVANCNAGFSDSVGYSSGSDVLKTRGE